MSNSPAQPAEPKAPRTIVRKAPAKTQTAAPTKVQAAAKPARTVIAKTAAKVVTPAPTKAPAKAKPALSAKAAPPATRKAPATKTAAPAKTARAAKPAAAAVKPQASKTSASTVSEKVAKEGKHAGKKPKLVRDSFTFPAADYALFGSLKQRALKAGHEVKKSELLRAGLAALAELSDSALLTAVQAIDRLKPGRPAK